MSISIKDWKPLRKGNNLLGFAVVEHQPSGMVVGDVTILTGPYGYWASPPSKPMIGADGAVMKDQATGKIRYVPIISFASKQQRNVWSDMVIAALRQAHPDALEEPNHAAAVDSDLQRRPWR